MKLFRKKGFYRYQYGLAKDIFIQGHYVIKEEINKFKNQAKEVQKFNLYSMFVCFILALIINIFLWSYKA